MSKPSRLFAQTLILLVILATNSALAEARHAVAMHGTPKYPAGFTHFDYTNPDAPKGGTIVLSANGSFDSFNPFILKGTPASYIGTTFDTLTVHSADEPFTEYGLIAKGIEIAQDNSSVTFYLDPDARFQDGHPITAEDVKYTFEKLINEGRPFYAAYYADVAQVDVIDPLTVRFAFKVKTNKELPLILGQMAILPKHILEKRKFDDDLLTPIPGSGPYRLKDYKLGQYIVLERNKDYWAKDKPVAKGMYNFDTIRVDYYRDQNVALEAFKSGSFDYIYENSSKRWATLYNGTLFDNGTLIKEEIEHQNPAGMQAFIFNTRKKELFGDVRVRKALNYAFDFEWTNKNLFYGAYKRSNSYFSNSELAATGLPSKAELALLSPYKDDLPAEVFTKVYQSPVTSGDGNIRPQLRKALRLLKQAGWEFKDKRLVNKTTGKPFQFEILLYSKDFERIVLPFIKNLEKLGITVTARPVDHAQYIKILQNFEFDMVIGTFAQSNSPGNEQRDYWFSAFADRKGSRNLIGVKDPVVDVLIEKIIHAGSREALITACRALDRVLLWNYYVIPQWHINKHRIAYKNIFGHPETAPKYQHTIFNWWIKPNQQKGL